MPAANTPYRRKSTYDFRARSPRDLQPYLGKVEEKFSLKKKDYAKARRLARKVSVDFDRHCERLLEENCSRQAKMPLATDGTGAIHEPERLRNALGKG